MRSLTIAKLVMGGMPVCSGEWGQDSAAAKNTDNSDEIPIEKCDVLPMVRVKIGGREMRFLLDTGATTILNLRSFTSGGAKEIEVSSWSGTAATSAREVRLPELALGSHRLKDLRLPAIDLSPIGKACGGRVDGILGVDLLDKIGVTIDLKRQVASMGPLETDAWAMYGQMEAHMHHCVEAFGGDALWYSYEYEITAPQEHVVGHGISMCRKDSNGKWVILNLHNSLKGPDAEAGAAKNQ